MGALHGACTHTEIVNANVPDSSVPQSRKKNLRSWSRLVSAVAVVSMNRGPDMR
jgi:hypothetical protein